MRHKYFGLAMAAVATLGPAQAFGNDREIAQSIMKRLEVSRDAGNLKDFSLDMKVDEGVALFRGKVADDEQRALVLASSEGIDGILGVVDELEVTPAQLATSKPAKIYKPKSATVSKVAEPSVSIEISGFDFAGALAGPTEAAPATEQEPQPTARAPFVQLVQETPHAPMTVLPNAVAPAPPTAIATQPIQEVVPQEVVPQEAVAQEAVAQEAVPQEAVPQEAVPQEAVAQEAVAQEAMAQEAVAKEAVAKEAVAQEAVAQEVVLQEVVPGIVLPAAAYDDGDMDLPMPAPFVEDSAPVPSSPAQPQVDDEQLMQSVARAITIAQNEGYLKNYGVDVHSYDGVIELEGTAASQQQREFLEMIARHAPGARGVRNLIKVNGPTQSNVSARPAAHRSGSPTMAPELPSSGSGLRPLPPANRAANSAMQPIRQAPPLQRQMQQPMQRQMQQPMQQQMHQQMRRPMQQPGVPARMANYPQGGQQMTNSEMVVPGSIGNHGGGYGAPMMRQPVPMANAAGPGAPRYDTPNLPNYAWPGYAAANNYAAVSYPQQYSPSAFPFIGPFYPYPQVPLGWRKVSLEWDDGWWFLDFTDK